MKMRYWFFSLALVAVVFLVEYDLARRMSLKSVVQAEKKTLAREVVAAQEAQVEGPVIIRNEDDSSFFESKSLKEAQKFSLNQSDPKKLDDKMDQLARDLSALEVKRLAIVMRSKLEDSETRAMAIELLTRSKTRDAMDVLKEFVVTPQTSGPVLSRTAEYESILRAQAIEGIAAYPQKDLALTYLNSMTSQVKESFLKDRIVRSEEGLKGLAPTVQNNDETALKQLVQ